MFIQFIVETNSVTMNQVVETDNILFLGGNVYFDAKNDSTRHYAIKHAAIVQISQINVAD